MRKLLAKIRKILRDRRTRRFLTRFVSGAAAIVVFVTTYTLVLPAITMEKEANCGIEAHQHDDYCYTEELICDIPESGGHHHDESCYSTTSTLICGMDEHEHSVENGCFDEDGNLICEKKEHRHKDECYEETRELTCQIPESEGHQHSDACYEKVLTCGKEIHIHSTACYENDPVSDSAVAASTSSAAATTSAGSVSSAGMTLSFVDETVRTGGTDEQAAMDQPVDNDRAIDNDGFVDNDGLGETVGSSGSSETGGLSETDRSSETASSGEGNTEVPMEMTYGGENAGTGSTEATNAALTNADNGATALTSLTESDQYIPPLEAVDFKTVLNDRTGIYYHHVADGETVEDSSAIPAEDWNRIPNNTDNTDLMENMDEPELGSNDLLRVYLSYTIPAGSLNATNPVARYRLPANLHLTDSQVKAINENVNGMTWQYVDMSALEITDPDMYNAYLGVEAVEGTRRPDETVEDYLAEQARKAGTDPDDAAEYISAVARVENVYDADGIYGEKDAYLGQDLIFSFAPYSIEKNQHEYDSKGQPTKAGQEIEGWLALDLNMGQVDFGETEITTSTVDLSEADNVDSLTEDDLAEEGRTGDDHTEDGRTEDDRNEDDHTEDGRIEDEDASEGQAEDEHNANDNNAENSVEDNENNAAGESREETESRQNKAVTIERAERTAEIVFVEDGRDGKNNKIDKISTRVTVIEKTVIQTQDNDTEENTEESGAENDSDQSDKGGTDQVIMPAMSFTDSIRVSTGKPAGIDEDAEGTLGSAVRSLPQEAEVSVRVEADEGTFPAGMTMVLKAVEDLDAVAEAITETVENSDSLVSADDADHQSEQTKNSKNNNSTEEKKNLKTYGFQAVDITFLDKDGKEIQPVKPVRVALTSEIAEQVKEEAKTSEVADPVVVHVDDNGNAEQMELVAPEEIESAHGKTEEELLEKNRTSNGEQKETETPDAAGEAPSVDFTADSFSVYAIVYTVDFHYEVNGKMYDFSIPGGGFVSLEHVVEVLGIASADENAENGAENAENVTENGYDFVGEVPGVDVSGGNSTAYEEAIKLNKVEVSEATKKFVADVESVEFSNPELVWVGKADEATTVGGIKENKELEIEYSANLTEEQIVEINAQTVEAGDWALISKQPFTSEETLTVTMKNGDQFAVKVTDAQISTHVLTADGERFRITITYDEDAKIPKGSVLVAEEIPEGSEKYEQYLEETTEKWEEDDKEGYISFARFFDIEIRKDGRKIEPEAAVEVEIEHEDGLRLSNDESFSVIHFADDGTEIIDELHLNETGTEVFYNQDSFSVIGTVSTVKDSGWPTANGQYVLVLQDGDDYYALKQDGTLTKIRYFNNTVSFIGEGTTTTDYINDYLWYVVSSGNRGKISDEYTEYNATPAGQTFIDLNNANIFSGNSRQLQINNGKIYCNGQLPGSSGYTQVTLSASGGQLSRVALTSDSASPAFFASASSFTANDNVTDLFTQIEVESIIDKWKEQKTQESTYDKTAEVYDYENRIYRVDIAASSSDYEVAPSIALEFVVDASRSMFFPTSLTQVGTFSGTNASNVRDWINSNGDQNQVYFVIQNKDGAATQYAIFWDPNSSYEVDHGWWTETRYGQWLWCDASVYNPPDDVSNGGPHSSMQSGLPLSTWWYDSFDDGKIYTTGITGSSDGTYGTRKTWVSRIEYLKQCARVASQVIYAVDENAQIGLIGFNAKVKDYGTFGKSQQQELLDNIDNISLDGGTNHQAGLQKAIDKYQDASFYAQHYAGRKHVVVLVTDGAPNQTGVNWTTIGEVANTLKNLEDDFGHKTELYTMGLSLSNVGSNQSNLFNISSGAGYTYSAEDAAQIINAITKIVDSIFVQANLVADVKDVIDPAFYPVNKTDGRPLAENDWINLSGTKVNAGANDAAGQIKKDSTTGNWYVEWKSQSIDWPTTDSNGGITEPGWHGTVFVKAKEDFLGGNGISTNTEGSQLEATKYIVRGDTEQHDLPEGDHTTSFETPYVNVDELDITKNDTEWTVYLGTNVDPLTEIKALWEKVKVKEVVTKTDSDHRMSSDGSLTYQYSANTNDNRPETNGREEFSISDLGITLTDDDWADLIAGNAKTFDYSAYDHSTVGTIMVSLTQAVKPGEKDLSESPHDTTVTGDDVEKYTLTVSYRPKGANITYWHTGSYGSGMAGIRAGNISKDNTHIINVYVKGLQITKVDLNDQVLPGAKFALYRSARTGETDLLEIDGEQYFKVAELDTSSTGIAVKEQIEQLEEGEQYYLVETEVPAGYIVISPIPVNLSISDIYTPKPGTTTQTTKPDSGIYDWTQNASLVLNAESGVKRTNADNTADLTHSAVTANSDMETIYYRITNNPGVELPSTGGPGTRLYTILGTILILGAGVLLWRRRRLI